jgi:pimeloyl-ACP methyl ester carboxylesterase
MARMTAVLDRLRTADGETLAVSFTRGPGSICVVLAHGFSGSIDKPPVRRIAAGLAEHASVLSYDARGHGRSTGLTTLGDREVLDVDTAVCAARALGFERVVTCGWSMGGSTVLRHAALRGASIGDHPVTCAPDAVVSVSATSRWFVRDTVPMRRLHRVVETRSGRAFARRVMRTRISPHGWDPLPLSPVECVAQVAPIPLLVVHGDRDGYFPVSHAHALVEAAGAPVELWVEEGFAHAESGASAELVARLGAHLPALLERA